MLCFGDRYPLATKPAGLEQRRLRFVSLPSRRRIDVAGEGVLCWDSHSPLVRRPHHGCDTEQVLATGPERRSTWSRRTGAGFAIRYLLSRYTFEGRLAYPCNAG